MKLSCFTCFIDDVYTENVISREKLAQFFLKSASVLRQTDKNCAFESLRFQRNVAFALLACRLQCSVIFNASKQKSNGLQQSLALFHRLRPLDHIRHTFVGCSKYLFPYRIIFLLVCDLLQFASQSERRQNRVVAGQ